MPFLGREFPGCEIFHTQSERAPLGATSNTLRFPVTSFLRWHRDCLNVGMRRETTENGLSSRALMRRWILEQDGTAITCHLAARSNRSFEVCILPRWDPSSAIIECFDALAPALLRHAEVSRRLRENGWIVIDQVGADHVQADA